MSTPAPAPTPTPATRSGRPGDGFAQARETAEALIAAGQVSDAVQFLLEALAAVIRTTKEQSLLIEKLRRGPGRSSEQINAQQLMLLMEELAGGGKEPEVSPEAEAREDALLDEEVDEARSESAGKREKTPRAPRKRQDWQSGAPAVVHECKVAADSRNCATCGREMTTIGHDVAEELRFVPGHFERHEYQREKLACGTCKDGVVTAGEGPLRILPRSAASASAIARVVVGKYADHLPLTRQHGIYKRDGVLIPVSTMADWVAGVADMLEPIVDEISRLALASYVLQGDSTGLPVLDPKESAANIRRGTMWCYVGDERNVVFRYTPTGEGQDGPWTFLRGREGYFQADAANMFDRVFDGQVASAIEVGCLAHLRRKFVALQDVDSRVAYPITLINRLYRFETLADAKELDTVGRQLLRAERAPPVLEKLRRYCLILIEKEPPSGKLAQAARYAINHWTALTQFVKDGRLQLDNNLCERQLRTVALTRRNALFAGSHDAAHRMAIIYSVLRTCALHGADPLAYLTAVLEDLARGVSRDRIPELLPDRWVARQR